MTRNPYAQMGNFGDQGQHGGYGGPGDFGGQAPTRTSALAVASLIVSIIGLLLCCIPGPGALGMFLAVGAVISISSSNGRRTGMGMAIAGLVLGLLATILTVLLWVGGSMAISEMTRYGSTMEAIWSRDMNATTAGFEPAAAAQITPERLESFVQEVESELGPYQNMAKGVGGFWSGYRQIGPSLQTVSGRQSTVPVPAEFANGYGAVLLEFPPQQGPGSVLRNIGVVLPRSQRVVWLLDPAASPLLAPPPPPPPSVPSVPPAGQDAPADGDEPTGTGEPAPEQPAPEDPATDDPASEPAPPAAGGDGR